MVVEGVDQLEHLDKAILVEQTLTFPKTVLEKAEEEGQVEQAPHLGQGVRGLEERVCLPLLRDRL